MKPPFDLDTIQPALRALQSRLQHADDDARLVENAVLPIFASKREGFGTQVGSGVLLKIDGEHFVLSASHVFDHVGDYALMLGRKARELMEPMGGDRFSTPFGPSGTHNDDPLDASVFHVQSGLTESVRESAIELNNLDHSSEDAEPCICAAVGYRSKRSRTIGREAHTTVERFLSCELGDKEYEQLGLDSLVHLALAFDDEITDGVRWQTSPRPRGVSGGAIIRYAGVPVSPSHSIAESVEPLLCGVVTSHRKRRKGVSPGALWGTRVRVHLALIRRYLPETRGLEPWLGVSTGDSATSDAAQSIRDR